MSLSLPWRRLLFRYIGTQFGEPHGPLGSFLGRTIFAQGNAKFNHWVIQQLDLQPTSRVLEVGCGPGVGLQDILARVPQGHVVGLDRSPVMVKQAKQRNRAALQAQRLEVLSGSDAALPFADGAFDVVVATHVLYFWADPQASLVALRRVLRQGGKIALGFVVQEHAPRLTQSAFASSGARFAQSAEDVQQILLAAGYANIRLIPNGDGGFCALGQKV
jgi:ubiquinone/menaquinone biosynthesis C-methylase UbiE